MLRNCTDEKVSSTAISSTTNQWPQNQILDGLNISSFMPSSAVPSISTTNKALMEKSIQDPAQNHLKCPRCDSSNTKFCYYNNYSLSQPRHFCKACKRYWTRGGTLRNVPVGGGCRKNKKVKRPPSGGGDGIPAAVKPDETDLSPASNHVNNPMLYSLPKNSLEPNFPFSRFNISTTRVSSDSAGFDNQPQVRLGFSSSGLMGGELQNTDYNNMSVYGSKHNFQDDVVATYSNSLVSAAENRPILFGSSSFSPNSTVASLLASGIHHQQRFGNIKDVQTSDDHLPCLMSYQDSMQMSGREGEMFGKELRMENGFGFNPNLQIEQIHSSEPSSLLCNTTNYVGAWVDPSNLQGSSVHSLI